MDIRQQKTEARKKLKAMREAICKDEKIYLDAALNEAILSCATFRFSDIIFAYYPVGSECNILPAVIEAMRKGKTVAFPRSLENGLMTFHTISSLKELIPGRFGIPEPPQYTPVCEETDISLCLVPGLSFDTEGYRMGYGGGYYDRYLSTFKGASAGICYSALVSSKVPRGRFDKKVSFIITDEGVMTIK